MIAITITRGESPEKDNDSSEDDQASNDDSPRSKQASPTFREAPSGVCIKGNWQEVTAACTDLTNKLEQACSKQALEEDIQFKEWSNWYPREQDDEQKLSKKTAKQARFVTDQSPKKHLEEGNAKFNSFKRHLLKTNLVPSMIRLSEASQKILSAGTYLLGTVIGRIEEFLYCRVVTRTNPYYFDNSLISASFRKINSFGKHTSCRGYELTIKVHDHKIKENFEKLILEK